MASPSSIISVGLGSWGSPSDIVLLGLGSAIITSGGGGGSSGGMMSWDGKTYPTPESLEKVAQKRIYFDETHSTSMREAEDVVEEIQAKGFSPEIYEEAVDVVTQLKTEIARLKGMEVDLEVFGREVEAIRAKMAIEQMRAQIEEIDAVFMIFMISAQIH